MPSHIMSLFQKHRDKYYKGVSTMPEPQTKTPQPTTPPHPGQTPPHTPPTPPSKEPKEDEEKEHDKP